MNKSDLVNFVAGRVDEASKALITKVVDAVFEGIKYGVATDGSVALVGHGAYTMVVREAREGRNPRTGETMHIPASKTIKFKAGKDFKDEVNKEA